VWSHWQVASRSSEVNFTKNYTLLYLLPFYLCDVCLTDMWPDIRLRKCSDIETCVRGHSSHRKCHHSTDRIKLPINVLQQLWLCLVSFLWCFVIMVLDSNFLPPLPYLTTRCREPHWNFATLSGKEKQEWRGYQTVKKVLRYIQPFRHNSGMCCDSV